MKPKLNLLLAASFVTTLPILGQAADIIKADNVDNLNLGSSWAGTAPGISDIALWNSSVTGANSTLLGANQTWGGIRLVNPGGAVTIGAGNTLTLGRGGIDMSAATQDLTIGAGLTLASQAMNAWSVASGRTLSVTGTLTRPAGASLKITNSGTVNIASGTASTVLAYGVLNGTDFAALNASKNVVGAASVITYAANTAGSTANSASMSGTVAWIDVTNSNPANAPSAFRLSGTLNTTGIRFNTANSNNIDWVVDANSRNFGVGNVLVTAGVGARNVLMNDSSGNVVRLGAGAELMLHQYNTAGDLIYNGKITQAAGTGSIVTKDGAGRVILANDSNSWAGATNINEGTLQVGNGGATGAINSASTINNNGNLQFNRTNNLAFTNSVNGSGTVTQAGTGLLTLSNASNGYSGGTVLKAGTTTYANGLGDFGTGGFEFSGGTLQMKSASGIDISGRQVAVSLGGGTLDTNGNDVTFANSIGAGGSGSLTKIGTGTLTLSSGSSYTGNTIITAGALKANGTMAGGATVGNETTLSGSATYGGTVTVNNGGIIAPGNSVGTLTTSSLTLASGAILNFEFNNTPANDQIAVTTAGGLTLNGGGFNLYAEGTTTPFSTAGSYNLISYSGAIGGTGTSALSVLNPQSGKSYTFGSTPSNVTLDIATSGFISNWTSGSSGSWGVAGNWSEGVPNAAGATANLTFPLGAPTTISLDGTKTVGGLSLDSNPGYTVDQGSGGTLTLDNGASQANIIGTSGSHVISAPVALNSNTVAAMDGTSSLTISGEISGASNLTKSGTGTLDLTNSSNSLSGNININGGTLGFAAAGSLGSGNLSLDAGTLRYDAGNTADISTRTITLANGGGTINTNGNDVSLANAIGNSGTGGLTKAGTGTLTLGAANTYSGPTAVTGGILSIGANSNLGDAAAGAGITLAGGTLQSTASVALDNAGANFRNLALSTGGGTIDTAAATTLTIGGTISGSTGLSKTGDGTLTLSGNNAATLASPITLSGGTLQLGGGIANGTQGLGTGQVIFKSGGTLSLNGAGATDGGSSYGNLTNALHVAAGQSGTLILAKRVTISSTLTGSGTLEVKVDGSRDDLQGNWSAFTGQINLTGAGEARLANFQNNVFNNSKLNIGAGVNLHQVFNPPSGSGTETIQSIGELSGAAGATLGGNPVGGRFVNWTVGSLNTNSEFAGTITDDAGASKLTKVGTGSLTLSGANTYTGDTNVNAGSLIINGSLGTTSINVASGASLKGSGSLAGPLTIAAGATLSPGNSPGTMVTSSSVSLNSTSILEWDLNGTNQTIGGGINDYFTGITTLTLDGVLNISETVPGSFAGLTEGTWTLMSYGTLIDNGLTLGSVPSLTNPDASFQLRTGNGKVELAIVPEPASISLLGLGLLFPGLRRRR